jgi:hypothetical protein
MTLKNAIPRFLTLASLLVLAAACAGMGTSSSSPGLPAGAASLGAVQPAAAPAAPPAAAPDPRAAEAVGRELPMLNGVPGDDQLRTLRWMLGVSDDRRLVNLFDDLRGQSEEGMDQRAAEARQRLEDLAAGLERAGHRAPDEAAGLEVATADPNAPEPNWFPPSLLEELAAHPDDPEAARALENARKISPRGTRPPR